MRYRVSGSLHRGEQLSFMNTVPSSLVYKQLFRQQIPKPLALCY